MDWDAFVRIYLPEIIEAFVTMPEDPDIRPAPSDWFVVGPLFLKSWYDYEMKTSPEALDSVKDREAAFFWIIGHLDRYRRLQGEDRSESAWPPM
ncbi:MAG: hypothetical protein HY720_10005 [Planctomycetes bacterium]|nr:hypothetical protein [Planctomycetota bacterium]